jgi:hypothetical protein
MGRTFRMLIACLAIIGEVVTAMFGVGDEYLAEGPPPAAEFQFGRRF